MPWSHAEPGPAPLREFQERLDSPLAPEPATLQPLLRALEQAGVLELALVALKRRHPESARQKGQGWGAIRARMELAVARSRERRMTTVHMDPNRRLLRVQYDILAPAAALNPPAVAAALARAFLTAGLPLAMGLEKTPRPVVHLGPVRPLGLDALGEWADIGLRAPLSVAPDRVPGLVNHHLPDGLRLVACRECPPQSTSVLDLCRTAHWTWPIPPGWAERVASAIQDMLAADRFTIEKTGKAAGQKLLKQVNIRPLVADAVVDRDRLELVLRLDPGHALNPQKLLVALLGLEPAALGTLVRRETRLAEDPRLANLDRYETKLSNLYEDAVLLSGSSPAAPGDDDDEEPLRLN